MSFDPSSRAQEKLDARKKNYKTLGAIGDRHEARKKREDFQLEIRKNKRDEMLAKRRMVPVGFQDQQGLQLDGQLDSTFGGRGQGLPVQNQLPDQTMIANLFSDNRELQLQSTVGFRKLLSIEQNPPIDLVIQSGAVPRFVQFLESNDEQLQFEAAWALTNIASGTSDHTQEVMKHDAIPRFVYLLSSPSDDVREQAVWALGNIAGDSHTCRDRVLAAGALEPVLNQLRGNGGNRKITMLRNAVWTLSNFCRGKPAPNFEQVKIAIPVLAEMIHSEDEDVLTDACWALSYLSDGTNDRIQEVVDSGVSSRLVELLLSPSPTVLIPALRTVGNIVTGDDQQTQVIIKAQALPCLLQLLTENNKKSIKKEACWTISNITAGNKDQIQAIIDNNIIPPLIKLLETAEFDIKKEAAWAISNATSGGTHEQIKKLVQFGCIRPLCQLLQHACAAGQRHQEVKITTVALEGLENILKVGEAEKELQGPNARNLFTELIEEANGLDYIEQLQDIDKKEICEKAQNIVVTYWDCEDDDEDQNLAPTVDPQFNQFNFTGQQHADVAFNFGANQMTE
mmetsp:Transcript_26747/g.32469  ORF Transcript_26747/g.32469 Transcript_26747/m.32469 type:complete len:567 (+) Transcript_26747:124-1824(+)|eukprot:CAMPEP_0197848636 /NCGR_PEP_ID=MMETSP1438-20131217/9411_1 /TAXON_ID=1461541 /ORGANISM="Pterosperma sp., Strain CCMP1384" /LENGTH=566 /DNA_ID=CAMNT_0043460979 /DNA_START=124 /DNA_END=1824 /DNA_ORIENTATION=-